MGSRSAWAYPSGIWQRKTLRGRLFPTDVITDERILTDSCGGESCVYVVFGQAGVESPHGVAVRMGVAEEDFEGAGRHKDEG
jgi:hypothetical protein